jgi:hypothetical protein
MPVKTRLGTLLLILVITVLSLQGCSVSGDGEETTRDTNAVNLSLATTTGSTLLVADGQSSMPIQLTVTNGSGQGVPNTAATFTTTAGSLSSGGTTSSRTAADRVTRATSVTATTDANGIAQATLTSSTQIETAHVTAQAMGFSTALSVNFISGTPAQVKLEAFPKTVGVSSTSTVRATVTTAAGAFVEGVTVTFALPVNSSGARLASASGITNGLGQASVVYTAGTVIGTDTVRASVPGDIVGSVAVSVQSTTVNASSLDLLVSSPQMDSDGSEQVTLTALARDSNNNFVSGVRVTFAANSDVGSGGGIQVTNGTTDASGKATALLATAGDQTNRTIHVTAVAGTLTDENDVAVTGTTVTLSGTGTLVLRQTTTLSILLRDSGGHGIPNQTVTVSSGLGNTLSQVTPTDFNGQTSVTVTATAAGSDIIQAKALGATGTFALTVSSANFGFSSPAPNTPVNLGAFQRVIVHWDEAGVNQVNKDINFFATRGTLTDPNNAANTGAAITVKTNSNGDALVDVSSPNAGPAVITATAVGGPSSQLAIKFVAIAPTSLILQASPTTLGVNTGSSTDQQSIITATIRDASGNLVEGQTVSFALIDVSGGRIFPASALTDSFGQASTVYTAGAVPSAQDGVAIDAEVVNPRPATPCVRDPASVPPNKPVSGPCARVTLTVARQALFVILGTGNTLQALSTTQYALPYSALVTDANGNPVSGVRVELNLSPTRYEKGFYIQSFDTAGNFVSWVKNRTVNPANGGDDFDRACQNEDANRNGRLDPGEDSNNNGELDPGNVATVPVNLTTNDTGFAFFDVVYAKEFTWVEVTLEARATVAGSESSSRATFFLPGLASDFTNRTVAPPGSISPYGIATTCACDELTAPSGSCPTATAAIAPVTITPGNVTLTNAGGTVNFTVIGGTQTSYTITTSAGVLSPSSTVTFVAPAGGTFTLTVAPRMGQTTSLIITVTAIDAVTGQRGSAIVTQLQ